ncbi:MAG TPA: fatty acid desaturase CarF family protein [Myxococcales bacterium]|jgi:ubiquitin-conjugating enzyme E2 variant|nr:fatty acid desaturase CarF family protein [Myxococcales bacterium]
MSRPAGALYLRSTPLQEYITWAGAGLNLACALWCFTWLALHRADLVLGWPGLFAVAVAGLFLADIYSGLIHWGTDTWFDETMIKRVVCIAREHHIYPSHINDYGFRDYVGYTSWPTVAILGPISLALTSVSSGSGAALVAAGLMGEVCLCMIFGTHFHRFGHRQAKSPVVKLLQRAHLLVTPQYHGLHHRANHDTHYCVVNGWANPLLDRVGFWRWLEGVVKALTGAVPRKNDHEWFARFDQDHSFMTNPVPSLLEQRRLEQETAS